MAPARRDIEEDLGRDRCIDIVKKVLVQIGADPENPPCGCWRATKSLKPSGYAQWKDHTNAQLAAAKAEMSRGRPPGLHNTEKNFLLHRVAFFAANGHVPLGAKRAVSHICNVRSCFNPAHLRDESQVLNIARKECPSVAIRCVDHVDSIILVVECDGHFPRCRPKTLWFSCSALPCTSGSGQHCQPVSAEENSDEFGVVYDFSWLHGSSAQAPSALLASQIQTLYPPSQEVSGDNDVLAEDDGDFPVEESDEEVLDPSDHSEVHIDNLEMEVSQMSLDSGSRPGSPPWSLPSSQVLPLHPLDDPIRGDANTILSSAPSAPVLAGPRRSGRVFSNAHIHSQYVGPSQWGSQLQATQVPQPQTMLDSESDSDPNFNPSSEPS